MAEVTLVNQDTWFHHRTYTRMFIQIVQSNVRRKFELWYRKAADDADRASAQRQRVMARLTRSERINPNKLLYGFVDFANEYYLDEHVEIDTLVFQYFAENPPVPNDEETMRMLDELMENNRVAEAALYIGNHIKEIISDLTRKVRAAPASQKSWTSESLGNSAVSRQLPF